MKVFVFDLDDTLYDEMTYVKSGFRAVAAMLSQRYGQEEELLYDFMYSILLEEGRGKVFNRVLEHIGEFSNAAVKHCVTIYRTHVPKLSLLPDAEELLTYLINQQYPIYIVTDGNKVVQAKKVEALLLKDRVNKVFITHRYGVKRAKPSPYCFNKILSMEQVEPHEVIYVGDNIAKDFVGIKPLGFKTARVLRGSYLHLERDVQFHAHIEVDTLLKLKEMIVAGKL